MPPSMNSDMHFRSIAFLSFLILVASHGETPRLLVISFGGFRHDYLDRYDLPNLKEFYSNGVKADWLQSVFVSDCAVNHYTLATGLYSESHGITRGDSYETATQHCSYICKNSATCAKEFAGEPIWVTNKKSPKSFADMREYAVVFWPNGENVLNDIKPHTSISNPLNATLLQKFDTVVKLFSSHSHDAINLGLLYHDEPDRTGHASGPNSPELKSMLNAIDDDFGQFVKDLSEKELLDDLNIIIVSDHGMAELSADHIYIDECLPGHEKYTFELSGPILNIWPLDEVASKEIVQNFTLSESCGKFALYSESTMPAEYHYSRSVNGRIAPLVLESPLGVPVYTSNSQLEKPKGLHGWNSTLEEMKAIFLAHGPSFKQGYKAKGFQNIHIYELMCSLLELTPAPNNGSLSFVKDMLADHTNAMDFETTIFTELLVIVGATVIGGAFVVGACRLQRSMSRRLGPGGHGRLVGLPGASADSRRLLAKNDPQSLLGGGATGSSDEESL